MRTLGKIFLVLILLVAVAVGLLFWRGSQLGAEVKPYVDKELPAILANWDAQELINRASPELLANSSEKDIRDTFAKIAEEHGPMTKYGGWTGVKGFHVNFDSGGQVAQVDGEATADFAKGHAVVRLSLIQRNGQWKFYGLFVPKP